MPGGLDGVAQMTKELKESGVRVSAPFGRTWCVQKIFAGQCIDHNVNMGGGASKKAQEGRRRIKLGCQIRILKVGKIGIWCHFCYHNNFIHRHIELYNIDTFNEISHF